MWKKRPKLGALPRDIKPTIAELAGYPPMTSWFNPVLLSKLLLKVVVSDVFGQYADRRLLEAALDTDPKQKLQTRDDISGKLPKDPNGTVWIDFVADLGDGFDATYAIAYLLAQPQLKLEEGTEALPRGGALFMGGDEVYPTASRDEYNAKLRAPYQFAFPNQDADQHPPIFAIPGNHDWYDGLVNFLAFFTRAKPTRIGNWRTQQRRSYFAAKISELCWVWAVDIALVADMDQPQADYFVAVAEIMPQGANIILCSAEPGWYKVDSDSYRSLSYAAWIAENAGKALKIPLVLSGDTHHYSRYESDSGTQYITSGGGGAFLHGTHQLPLDIEANWLRHSNEHLHLKAAYPTKERSRSLLLKNLLFPFVNFGFSLFLGAIFAMCGFFLSQVPRLDVAVILFLMLTSGFVGYSVYQEKRGGTKVVSLAVIHCAAQFAAMLFLTCFLVWLDSILFSIHSGPWWAWFFVFTVTMTLLGGMLSGLIFGVNLLLTCAFADMNHNDAFSAMRLNSYRHFLRLKIIGDQITVYPIGFDKSPLRREWSENPKARSDSTQPYFLPPEHFSAHLIEPSIVISGAAAEITTNVRKPTEIPSR